MNLNGNDGIRKIGDAAEAVIDYKTMARQDREVRMIAAQGSWQQIHKKRGKKR